MSDQRSSELQAIRVAIAHQQAELDRAKKLDRGKKSNAEKAEIERIRQVLMRLERSLRELSKSDRNFPPMKTS